MAWRGIRVINSNTIERSREEVCPIFSNPIGIGEISVSVKSILLNAPGWPPEEGQLPPSPEGMAQILLDSEVPGLFRGFLVCELVNVKAGGSTYIIVLEGKIPGFTHL